MILIFKCYLFSLIYLRLRVALLIVQLYITRILLSKHSYLCPVVYESVPNQYKSPPRPKLIPKCMPKLHATQYRYLGENTVHTNKCVRSAVQAAMTATALAAANTVSRLACCSQG